MEFYADVILPLPLEGTFTYRLPLGMERKIAGGERVIVPFGQKKLYTGLVYAIHTHKPSGNFEIKEVIACIDKCPVVLPSQLTLWEWIADYYICSIGDVFKAALPSGMKLESESSVCRNEEFKDIASLNDNELQIWQLLEKSRQCKIRELARNYTKKNILSVLQGMMKKTAVIMKESLQTKYKPRTEEWVGLTENMKASPLFFKIQMDGMRRADKQNRLFHSFMELCGQKEAGTGLSGTVRKTDLLASAGVSSAILNALVKKNVFCLEEKKMSRLDDRESSPTTEIPPLSLAQDKALREIIDAFKKKRVCLLHGVTSSGKTEIYIHLIREYIKKGKQVLYLLPEIALTTQITERLRRVFGNTMGIYHSKFPDAERVEIWQKQLSGKPFPLLLGVRSSVFLPFQDLGLIIVDEEHESTYKQQDPAPRYHARNTAVMMAAQCGANVLLGTATPSLDSYHNTQTGKYALVELTERFRHIELPEINVIDMKTAYKRKQTDGPFSYELIKEIKQTLKDGEQVILFQNRRGYAPVVECKTCGWVPHCPHCDVALTYHKQMHTLSCHYCGYTCNIPERCPACGEKDFFTRGFGTEKVEDKVHELFPHAVVDRLDLDTARTRTAYERIFSNFASQKTDILIGTQMVSKGLDFAHVRVVGILNADTMLNYPDFRAYEKAFQMMEQVAGRAGRSGKRGLVLLQTKNAELPLIRQVVDNDYTKMYEDQLSERQLFNYPPFTQLIYVYLKHRDATILDHAALEAAGLLRTIFGSRVLGPDKPVVARIQTLFIRTIILKIEPALSRKIVRTHLQAIKRRMEGTAQFYYDVDPL